MNKLNKYRYKWVKNSLQIVEYRMVEVKYGCEKYVN